MRGGAGAKGRQTEVKCAQSENTVILIHLKSELESYSLVAPQ